jgi:hypothetical protein
VPNISGIADIDLSSPTPRKAVENGRVYGALFAAKPVTVDADTAAVEPRPLSGQVTVRHPRSPRMGSTGSERRVSTTLGICLPSTLLADCTVEFKDRRMHVLDRKGT